MDRGAHDRRHHGGSNDSWDKPFIPGNGSLPITNLLTLDAMLGCWARDHIHFKRIADRVESYIEPVIAHATARSEEERKRLDDFKTVWKAVSVELLKDH